MPIIAKTRYCALNIINITPGTIISLHSCIRVPAPSHEPSHAQFGVYLGI